MRQVPGPQPKLVEKNTFLDIAEEDDPIDEDILGLYPAAIRRQNSAPASVSGSSSAGHSAPGNSSGTGSKKSGSTGNDTFAGLADRPAGEPAEPDDESDSDDEPEDGGQGGAQGGAKVKYKQPCKGKRKRYKKLVAKFEESIRAEPFAFTSEDLQASLPSSALKDARSGAKLLDRLTRLLEQEQQRAREGLPPSAPPSASAPSRAGGAASSGTALPSKAAGAPPASSARPKAGGASQQRPAKMSL